MNEGERSSGVVIGKVTAVKDPTKLGQIQVTYPWLSGPETRWVSVAAPMAGKDRGFFCMPRVDDEVILAFHMGMWDHPIVIGFTSFFSSFFSPSLSSFLPSAWSDSFFSPGR